VAVALLLGWLRVAGTAIESRGEKTNEKRLMAAWLTYPGLKYEMANLSTVRFASFLAWLDSDPVTAAEKYLALRHKLVKIFERTQCGDPESLADEAMDRIAKKLGEGAIHNLNSYAYAVAMKISLEIRKASGRFVSIDHNDWQDSLVGDPDPEKRIVDAIRHATSIQCMDRCLKRLPTGDHELLLQYYAGEKQVRIQHRQELAEKRGTSLARLRSEVNTLREKLRGCVHRCLRTNPRVAERI
jgi:DNA-directed RNA polymerase specialized sigma24 family protein